MSKELRLPDDLIRLQLDRYLPPSMWERTLLAFGLKRARDPRLIVLACCLALAMLVAISAASLVLHLRQNALFAGANEVEGLSAVLADQAERAFTAVELVQTGLLERLQRDGVETPDAFRERMSGSAVYDDLRGRINGLPQIDAIVAIDADGDLVNFSRSWPTPRANVADRDYFQALKGSPETATFIGEPVINRGTGAITLVIARAVRAKDGAFLGLVLGPVQLTYFERLYHNVAPHPDSSISLFRNDGMLLARYPFVPSEVGRSYASQQIFQNMQNDGPTQRVVQQRSLADGQERLIGVHRVEHFPMLLTATRTVQGALSDWRSQATFLMVFALVLEVLIVSAGCLICQKFHSHQLLQQANAAKARAEAAHSGAEAQLALAREQERAARLLNLQNLRFGVAVQNMSQALCMFDSRDRLVVANARLCQLFALKEDEFVPGVSFDQVLASARMHSSLEQSDVEDLCLRIRAMQAEGAPMTEIFELADERSIAVNFQPVADEGWLLTLEDISERRQAEVKIVHMAHHDALTGLPNRIRLRHKLVEALARSWRGEPFAVLCLDLDFFKAVNDTLGHSIGDDLLRAVTARLQSHLRETDTFARLGGDEFAIVQTSIEQPHDATALAARIIDAISAPYDLSGHQVVIGASVGVAVVPGDGDDPDQILRNADLALYRAKEDGRGRYRFFEPEMDALMQARRRLQLDLRKAVLTGEFTLNYQPLVDLASDKVVAFEALLRWNHPERGLVSPEDFIPLAEEMGLIVPLGQWVLREACRAATSWPGNVKVAVNLSAVQFGSRTLVADVAGALTGSGLDPHRLELEITETIMLENTDATLATLHELRDLGVGIAMDDFGIGYSSLSYLRSFPFDKVKIDRSFVNGLGNKGDCDAIITAVTGLCDRLGIRTVAEGVETQAQLDFLRSSSCTEVQGFLFSKARPAIEVAEMCERINDPAPYHKIAGDAAHSEAA